MAPRGKSHKNNKNEFRARPNENAPKPIAKIRRKSNGNSNRSTRKRKTKEKVGRRNAQKKNFTRKKSTDAKTTRQPKWTPKEKTNRPLAAHTTPCTKSQTKKKTQRTEATLRHSPFSHAQTNLPIYLPIFSFDFLLFAKFSFRPDSNWTSPLEPGILLFWPCEMIHQFAASCRLVGRTTRMFPNTRNHTKLPPTNLQDNFVDQLAAHSNPTNLHENLI